MTLRIALLVAMKEFRAALAIDPKDMDGHMALLAELSLMTHKRPGDQSPTEEQRWVREFVDELATVREDFGQNPDVQRILTAIFQPVDLKTDSVSAVERDKLRQVGYAFFRWKRR